jgi:hypothetical protein
VRATVGPHGCEPEQLGGFEHPTRLLPWRDPCAWDAVSGVELCDGFVHPQNSFQAFCFSREAREKIAILSLCAKENWKGKNDAMPPKVRMVAPFGKQVGPLPRVGSRSRFESVEIVNFCEGMRDNDSPVIFHQETPLRRPFGFFSSGEITEDEFPKERLIESHSLPIRNMHHLHRFSTR